MDALTFVGLISGCVGIGVMLASLIVLQKTANALDKISKEIETFQATQPPAPDKPSYALAD
jgi:hypothetical protein